MCCLRFCGCGGAGDVEGQCRVNKVSWHPPGGGGHHSRLGDLRQCGGIAFEVSVPSQGYLLKAGIPVTSPSPLNDHPLDF